MSVFVEITSSLGRRLTVSVPVEQVKAATQAELTKIARTAKIDGFRAGKIPTSVIEKRFGTYAHSEAVEKLLQSSLRDALIAENLHPAATPVVQSLKAEPGKAIEYNVTFDVYPEVKLQNLSDAALEKPTVTITEADVDQVLNQIRQQHVLWEEVVRPAAIGDRLTVDIQGMLNDQPVEQLNDKNTHLVLDETALPAEFLVLQGTQAGDTITLSLPANQTAAAKQVVSHLLVTVHAIAEPKLPELDAEFAKKFGLAEASVESLRTEVRNHMQKETEQVIKNKLKEQVIEILLQRHSIEIPHSMLDEEVQHLEKDLRERIKQESKQKTNVQLSKTDREKLQEVAQRRVTLGLIFPTVIKENNITADQERINAHLKQLMAAFEHSGNISETLMQDKDMMMRIQSQVLEEQVIDHLLKQVQLTEKAISYTEALELGKTPNKPAHQGPSDTPVR
jgi:trigger factor